MIIGTRIKKSELERGLYMALRKAVVKYGYSPDKSLVTGATPEQKQQNWLAMISAWKIANPGRPLILVKGVGSGEARGRNEQNTIYIDYSNGERGTIGGWKEFIQPIDDSDSDPDPGSTKYEKVQIKDMTRDLVYEIRFKTTDTNTLRILEELIQVALGERRYIKSIKQDASEGQAFLLYFNGEVDLSDGSSMERMGRFQAVDIWLLPEEVLVPNIPATTDILGQIEAVEDFQDMQDSDSDGDYMDFTN